MKARLPFANHALIIACAPLRLLMLEHRAIFVIIIVESASRKLDAVRSERNVVRVVYSVASVVSILSVQFNCIIE